MLTNGETIVLFWVDDCIFYSKKSSTIDNIISSLDDEFILEKEEDVADFLGFQMERDEDNNTLTMTQSGLIDRILVAMDMQGCNLKYAPTEKDPLCKDEDGEPCCEN